MKQTDVIIIGGGIVGLATAYQFTLHYPRLKITLLEKEPNLAIHQTGHNSGVLHTGIYYKPGSLKALNCRQGKTSMEEFCMKEGIDFEICDNTEKLFVLPTICVSDVSKLISGKMLFTASLIFSGSSDGLI